MTSTRVVRVILVERHPVVRTGLATLLATAGMQVVSEIDHNANVAGAVRRSRPHVLVADVESGLAWASTESFPPVVVLSFQPAKTLMRALRCGVRGVVDARCTPGQLVAAVNLVATGGMAFSVDDPRHLDDWLHLSIDEKRTFGALTARETEILDLLAAGMTNADISRRLALSAKTVRNGVSVVLRKLGVDTRAEAVELARTAGLGRSARKA